MEPSEAASETSGAVETNLAALLAEVRALRGDIEILKLNPSIGDAVSAALSHARANPGSAYNVAVAPGPAFEGDPAITALQEGHQG